MDKMLTGNFRSENNPADIATKVLGGGAKRNGLISHLLHDPTELVWDDLKRHYHLWGSCVLMGLYGFPWRHTLDKYGTRHRNMSCIELRYCNLVPSSWYQGDYFNRNVVDAIADARLTDV